MEPRLSILQLSDTQTPFENYKAHLPYTSLRIYFGQSAGTVGPARRVMQIRLDTNFAIFVLFFGVSMLEAFQTGNWVKALFWLAIGLVFLLADNFKKKRAV